MIDMEYTLDIMRRLCQCPSPTGYSHNITALIELELRRLGLNAYYTQKGSIYTVLEGKSGKTTRTLAAHVDTLGAMVAEILQDGRLRPARVGGYTWTAVECENCIIHADGGEKSYTGVIYYDKPSGHVESELFTEPRTNKNMRVVVDERVTNKADTEALGIDVGDYISLDSRFSLTDSGFIKSRHLDDKASAAIMFGVLKYHKDAGIVPEDGIQFYFTVYEEVGHGASAGILDDVNEMLCVDMGISESGQNGDEYSVSICTMDGRGPYDFELTNRLVKLSRLNEISYKKDIFPRYSSDCASALLSGRDVKFALIGPGIYASHSYERTHVDAIKATGELIIKYLQ